MSSVCCFSDGCKLLKHVSSGLVRRSAAHRERSRVGVHLTQNPLLELKAQIHVFTRALKVWTFCFSFNMTSQMTEPTIAVLCRFALSSCALALRTQEVSAQEQLLKRTAEAKVATVIIMIITAMAMLFGQ